MDDQTIRAELHRAISSYRAYEEKRWADVSKEANRWQVEAVKHLAVLNATALAGSVALFARKDSSGALLVPMGLFLIAFIVLVFGMHLACAGLFHKAGDYVGRMRDLDSFVASHDGDPRAGLEYARTKLSNASTAGDDTLHWAVRLVWAAAGLFIVGAIILITLLYCSLYIHQG